jgi:16S rRNA (uracil1498-N3)-methyltransferase
MARRMFYASRMRGGRAWIEGEAARHLRRVLRVEPGMRFELSDNEQLYLAAVSGAGKDQVEFELIETLAAPAMPARTHLLAALVKFDHFEWMIEKATELGVERITPVYSARCDKGLDQAAEKRMERWRRIIYESGQQSRRVRPPDLGAPLRLKPALATEGDVRLWLEEQRGATPLLEALAPARAASDRVLLLCGPEGGWDDAERALARESGWTAVSLGPLVLRAETAALAALAVVNAAWMTAANPL